MVLLLAGTAQAGVVLNEIDYDNIGSDNAEWVELYNPDGTAQSLVGYDLVLINSATVACAVYRTVALDAHTIPAGGYLVLGANACAAAGLGVATDAIQNGAPDAAQVVIRASSTVVSSVEYENAGATVCGQPPTNATDSNTVAGSISRCPEGWVFGNATPCANNACTVAVEEKPWGTYKKLYR
jgi:hypothetical protein